jgi:hypothetical protein
LRHIEEVGRLQMAVALRIAGVDGGRVDGRLDAGLAPVLLVEHQVAGGLDEPAAHGGVHHVLDRELGGGVRRVDLEGLGCREDGSCDQHREGTNKEAAALHGLHANLRRRSSAIGWTAAG